MTVINWALVGTSGYAERECLPSFAATPSACLAAVVSSSAGRAAEFARANGVPRGYDAVERACADDGVNAVWIASPSYQHYQHAPRGDHRGQACLARETGRPGRPARGGIRRARRTARGPAGHRVQARYVPGHVRMRALIADGELGSVVAVRSLYGMRRPGPPRTWRGRRETARWGVLADIGTHHIDLMRMLAGEITDATGYTEHQRGFETEDLAVASFRFACGALGTMTAAGHYFRPATVMEVVGTEGRVVATDNSPSGQGRVILTRADGSEADITGETRSPTRPSWRPSPKRS